VGVVVVVVVVVVVAVEASVSAAVSMLLQEGVEPAAPVPASALRVHALQPGAVQGWGRTQV
jgi:hypothetical protein